MGFGSLVDEEEARAHSSPPRGTQAGRTCPPARVGVSPQTTLADTVVLTFSASRRWERSVCRRSPPARGGSLRRPEQTEEGDFPKAGVGGGGGRAGHRLHPSPPPFPSSLTLGHILKPC